MAEYTLRLDMPKLHAVGMRRARTLVKSVTRRTLNRSAILCPVDTGYLRSTGGMSTTQIGDSEYVGEVEYTARYAAAVHQGRRALTIRPRKPGGLLRFRVGGKIVYARVVHQRARIGRPFLADAMREVARSEGFTVTLG